MCVLFCLGSFSFCHPVFSPTLDPTTNNTNPSVRTLLPDALDAEDLAEQERRAREANSASTHHHKRRKTTATPSRDEPLPSSASASGVELPAWVLTLVCFVVVVAMAVGRP